MPNRIANVSLTVHRNGSRFNVKPGQKFNFTKDEIADFTTLNPAALRLPINESVEDDAIPPQIPEENENPADDVDLSSLSVADLRSYAKEHNLDVDLSLNKAQLLEAISAKLEEGDL